MTIKIHETYDDELGRKLTHIDFECDNDGDKCHMIIIHEDECIHEILYENIDHDGHVKNM